MYSERVEKLPIASVFCEPFSAANAVKALDEMGFTDNEIDLIGVLGASNADLSWLLCGIGIPSEHATYYHTLFEDGAVLLMVSAQQLHRRETAARVLKRHGGIFPPQT